MPRDKRSLTIFFRATAEERAIIDKQAKKLNLKLSEYVRLCVLNDISNRQKAAA